MQSVLNNLKTLEILSNNKIDVKFIKKFDAETLIKCCNKIDEIKIPYDVYAERNNIQYELINNEDSIRLFNEIDNIEILDKINKLLKTFQANNEKITDYNYERIICVLNNEYLEEIDYYDCIKYFNIEDKNIDEQNIIAQNISFFNKRCNIPISELNENEKKLFNLPYLLSYKLIPYSDIRNVYELLINDNYLKDIIHFLYNNNIEVYISSDNYNRIHNDSKEISILLKDLYNLMERDTYIQMLELWIENKCNLYDLKELKIKLKDLNKEEHINKFQNRGSYINYIYGDVIKNLELKKVDGSKENLIISAIVNNKKSFLKLIQENQQLFFELSYNSLLFNEDFYAKYFNINSLTKKDLEKLEKMTKSKSNLYLLDNRIYTFKEIETLYGKPKQYFILYNNLLDLKIDSSEQTLKVTGKGNKQRIIYLNVAVCEAINAYLKVRPKLDKSNKDYNALFISSRQKRISNRSVQNITKTKLIELLDAIEKESKKYHTHTLRHSGATLLYNEANADIFVLKLILGHSSLEATQLYTHVSDKKLKELMQNFNILDKEGII